ncbi:localization factor PodJL [Methylobacterium sp. PvP062]|uniref:Localization factor PodJL n=1 Tax=Methylobacterium radiotolerans TaxID=31998 RepID=A0ABV2NDJ2_9HYPH|nr:MULTISPECIES: SEL1-like repeat protein [unclassified Methylobacterium]MBP2492211.1 localization factor PodJL [Methylobacterium sp. PvP105]MBP2501418.1 localization factor PodJL [Methylobacterium sp. PvP109]MCX7332882.1 SEL1-like repeat protein [Hyphomicrobiales bacterium]
MTRNAMPQLDSFDPEVLDAARDVAARAGVPLETWIASVVPQQQSAGQGNRRHRRRHRAEQLALGGSRPEASVERSPPPASPDHRPHGTAQGADGYGDGIAALMDRLDGLDRALDYERRAAQEAEARRLAEIESRIERALKAAPVQQVTERLGDIERRMSQLGEQVAATRQPGRRPRPAAADIRSAVQDIRQRQRELAQSAEAAPAAAPADGGVVASMRLDLARRLEARIEEGVAPSTALLELQEETTRLREAINQLATSRDIGALEQAVVTLASGIERAQAGTDLTAIAVPIEQVRAQVERLAEEVAENVHSRVAEDVRRLAERLDTAAATGAAGPDDHTLAGLFAELEEIRRQIGALAGPERIQGLAQSLQAVSAQIAQLQRTAAAPDLRPLLEEIRSDVKIAAPVALAEQIQALAEKVDVLCARDDWSERAGEASVARSGDMASIHAMLRSLAEKVDQVGTRSEQEGLDALERQVVSLAGRLDAPHSADPALAGLERTMGDLLRQVTALRETAPSEAVVERAARNAVAQTLQTSGLGTAESGEIGLLRASLADMQARQVASDQRLGATLEGVQSALERLLVRLGPAEAVPARAPSLDERLMSSTSPEVALAPVEARPKPRRDGAEASRLADDLLEPGSGRPPREPRSAREPSARRPAQERLGDVAAARSAADAKSETDIKTSFIAAARRAAQAAQAELAAEAPAERREARGDRVAALQGAATGRLGRLRAEIDRRRRPLLLGLAAIVLALGALQAITMRGADEPRPAAPTSQVAPSRGDAATVQRDAPDVSKDAVKESAEAKPAPADPTTTQALPSPVPAEARPNAKSAVPQVSGMNTLQAELGNLPPALAKVKLAALDGDGAAIWDLATREADGRGMPRDLSIAAKLYEKLASAGYAPAQYKLAGHYEKGSGVVRDLDKAKLWYGRAAEQGHARSMHNLAVLYAENPAANGKPDFASAASWFRQGAEFGVRDSQYNLGVLYARGLGLTQDLIQSYAWFSAAASQGDDDAGKKRDDVANKLSPADLASAKSLAANFKPRKIDAAVNEPPAPKLPASAPMSLLGAPMPGAVPFTAPPRRS